MAPKKLNCWEFMKCERGPGGSKAAQDGVCPVIKDDSFDGINEGRNAGRVCWAVAGTCCGGKVQGTFAEKRETCTDCEFYKKVQEEEGNLEKISRLFDILPEKKKESLFGKMTCKVVKPGEKIIRQGEIRESAFVIQRGSCLVLVEKKGELHPVDHRSAGDIVGVTSILTGEPQTAHVEAETAMELWEMPASLLNDISSEHQELADFLTEIVATRFDSKRPVADRTISKYMASDIIGRGAYSIVYKGLHANLNMPVAIKMMKHDMAMNSDFLAQFKEEAKILAKLNHENIVRVHDIEERYRTVFIIMEYLTGNTLKHILSESVRLSETRTVNFMLQMCEALKIAHQNGIVHQDIKPGNIFIMPNDRLKILDFGLACPPGSENFLMGTPFYMAPEQVQCVPVDQRSDIYSLGLVIFRMITGKKPFEGDNVWRVMEMRTEQEIPDPVEYAPDISESLRAFILKACARDPDRRYQDISEALSSISEFINGNGFNKIESSRLKRNMQSFYLVYGSDKISEIKTAIEDFNIAMQRIGVELKTGDIIDV